MQTLFPQSLLALAPADLPTVNACLNTIATILLIVGLVLIKAKRISAHRNCMISAFAVSAVFLVLYVTDKVLKGGVHTPFAGTGYYVILISHIILAITVPVFAILLIRLGLKHRIAQHRRLAKVGYPIWLYVSITGVVIYVMLYH
ncbi:MAG: DUF420 domain-containing protein [Phycisphaeraceae bacterium]|jgi:uncharacterized membrane protein YozB (DUF420 family)|nr:DUF420 domain-containing protein [Phycisphaeraceae bacterium]MDP7348086.1 DUF420 domain-containing protein [Phycisphaeraceae bacterium]